MDKEGKPMAGENIAYRVKNFECGVDGTYVNTGPNDLCADPQLTGPFKRKLKSIGN